MKPPISPHPLTEIQSQDVLWSGRSTLRMVRFRHRRFDGAWSAPMAWELWQRGTAAAMLPYDPIADRVVLIDQFRLPVMAAGVDPIMREIPAGMCETGEAAEATIRRELMEEAGIEARRSLRIGDYVLSAGSSDERIFVFVGEVTAPIADANGHAGLRGLDHENEDIRVVVQPADLAIEQALAGAMANPVATIALLWLAARRDWLRGQWA